MCAHCRRRYPIPRAQRKLTARFGRLPHAVHYSGVLVIP